MQEAHSLHNHCSRVTAGAFATERHGVLQSALSKLLKQCDPSPASLLTAVSNAFVKLLSDPYDLSSKVLPNDFSFTKAGVSPEVRNKHMLHAPRLWAAFELQSQA